MSEEKLSRLDTDWDSLLEEDEKMTKEGDEFVRLRGLQRLARRAGLVYSMPQHAYIETKNGYVFQCVYVTRFDDGTEWGGSADFNKANAGRAPYSHYPTAVVESRAEARALRKALGIKSLSVEEIGTMDNSTGLPNTSGGVDTQQVASIERLVTELKLDKLELAKTVFGEDVASSISSWEELTSAQAIDLLRHLNKAKADATKAERKGTAKSTAKSRAARKAELEKKVGESS